MKIKKQTLSLKKMFHVLGLDAMLILLHYLLEKSVYLVVNISMEKEHIIIMIYISTTQQRKHGVR